MASHDQKLKIVQGSAVTQTILGELTTLHRGP